MRSGPAHRGSLEIERQAAGVGELAPRAVELATDVGAQQAYLAGGREPLIAEHVSVDGEPISIEGGAVGVGELAPRADELATDVGAQQAYLAGGREPLVAEHVLRRRRARQQ